MVNSVASAGTVPQLEAMSLKIAVVHDWLPLIGGAERVLQQMVATFPQSEIFTVFDFLSDRDRLNLLGNVPVHVSKLNRLPAIRRYYRSLLLLAMRAVETFCVTNFDAVLSSSAAIAKGVITSPDQRHIAYIHSPARYAWDLSHDYIESIEGAAQSIKRAIAREVVHNFRIWDMRTVCGVDHFIANSKFIQNRIWKTYKRESEVIYPPVNISDFQPGGGPRNDYYFTASRLVPYKNVPMIVEAFNRRPDLRLVVAGDGPDLVKVRRIAGPNITLLGQVELKDLVYHMQHCRAFVFAAKEDFGIVPVEAMACGAPVIALGAAGTAETIRGTTDPNPTGVLFESQTPEHILAAVEELESNPEGFTEANCRAQAVRFGAARFRRELTDCVAYQLSLPQPNLSQH